jgi:glycosyltransferase involved in cell wall biosynthesis
MRRASLGGTRARGKRRVEGTGRFCYAEPAVRVLHVIHRYPPAIGGGELWCAGLARWQAAHGHEVRVLTLRAVADDELWGEHLWGDDLDTTLARPPGPVAVGDHDRQDGVEVTRCAVGGPLYGVARVLSRARLDALSWGHGAAFHGRLVAEARRADVVHAYWLGGPHALAAWVAARLARRPYVLTPFFHAGFAAHESRAATALLRRADRLIALTGSEAAALAQRGVPPDRILRSASAVDTTPGEPAARGRVREALGVPADARLLCYVGRKAPNKGLDVLLRALPMLRHRPAPWLALAGPGTQWYRERLAAARAAHVVDLAPVSEARKRALLAAADVLVLPSRLESFGIVFLEAWAADTAVVGADIAAVREVVGDAGRLFRPDDAADLAVTLDALLTDDAARSALAARGRARVAAHGWDRLGTAIVDAYAAIRRPPAAAA